MVERRGHWREVDTRGGRAARIDYVQKLLWAELEITMSGIKLKIRNKSFFNRFSMGFPFFLLNSFTFPSPFVAWLRVRHTLDCGAHRGDSAWAALCTHSPAKRLYSSRLQLSGCGAHTWLAESGTPGHDAHSCGARWVACFIPRAALCRRLHPPWWSLPPGCGAHTHSRQAAMGVKLVASLCQACTLAGERAPRPYFKKIDFSTNIHTELLPFRIKRHSVILVITVSYKAN